jgi:hypothetical protein
MLTSELTLTTTLTDTVTAFPFIRLLYIALRNAIDIATALISLITWICIEFTLKMETLAYWSIGNAEVDCGHEKGKAKKRL